MKTLGQVKKTVADDLEGLQERWGQDDWQLKSVWEYYDNHKQLCDSQGQTQSKFKVSDHLAAKQKVQTAADDEESKLVTNVAPAPSVVLHIKILNVL